MPQSRWGRFPGKLPDPGDAIEAKTCLILFVVALKKVIDTMTSIRAAIGRPIAHCIPTITGDFNAAFTRNRDGG
jgi:hypothetical protein